MQNKFFFNRFLAYLLSYVSERSAVTAKRFLKIYPDQMHLLGHEPYKITKQRFTLSCFMFRASAEVYLERDYSEGIEDGILWLEQWPEIKV